MKILLIQHRQIGDVLMCTPSVRALRKKYPEAEITFLVEPFSLNAVRHNQNIDRFITVPRRMSLWKFISVHLRVRRASYDAVVDFFKNPKSAWLTWMSRADMRISLKGRHRNFAYTHTVDMGDRYEYAAIQKLRLLRPLDIEEEKDCLPEFFITDTERAWADRVWADFGFSDSDIVAAVSPVSRRKCRVWPGEYYARLCDHLISARGVKVILTWGPEEEDFIKPIVRNMRKKAETDYPMPSLGELYALFEKCSLFIGNDNGPRHMAVAAGIPTLGLFGRTCPSSWTPPDADIHETLRAPAKKTEKNRNIYDMQDLLPETAIEAADRMVRKLKQGDRYNGKKKEKKA